MHPIANEYEEVGLRYGTYVTQQSNSLDLCYTAVQFCFRVKNGPALSMAA
jgi:hypothetical protein